MEDILWDEFWVTEQIAIDPMACTPSMIVCDTLWVECNWTFSGYDFILIFF